MSKKTTWETETNKYRAAVRRRQNLPEIAYPWPGWVSRERAIGEAEQKCKDAWQTLCAAAAAAGYREDEDKTFAPYSPDALPLPAPNFHTRVWYEGGDNPPDGWMGPKGDEPPSWLGVRESTPEITRLEVNYASSDVVEVFE